MTTYEPGTVATATVRGVPNVRVFRVRKAWVYVDSSHTLNPSTYCALYDNGGEVTDVRPLIVLDLRDDDTALAVAQTLKDSRWFYDQEAGKQIEAQTRPPKPPEPTGLGAVVEDAEGGLWFRMAIENQTWPGEVWQEQYGDPDRWSKWDSVDVVRVLSEGVQP